MKSKRIFGSFIAIALLTIVSISCNKEYFEIDNVRAESLNPTFAVPLADMDIELIQLINRFRGDLENVPSSEFHDPADSVFFLRIQYSDTLDAIAGPVLPIPGGQVYPPIEFPLDSLELNIFGTLGGGSSIFRLLNPSVGFTFINTIDKAFNLTFDSLYTKDIETNVVYPFKVKSDSLPFLIEKGNPPSNGASSFVRLSNNNTESYDGTPNPMSNVLEPTPKFVFNKIRLSPIGTEATQAGGEVKVVGSVLLPLEGYGRFRYRDTIPLNNFDTTDIDLIEEVLIRMIITNGLPVSAVVNSTIYDSLSWRPIYTLPIYDQNGNPKPDGAFLEAPVVSGPEKGFQTEEPTRFYSDIRMNAEEYKLVSTGNTLIIDADFFTSNFDAANLTNSQIVNWYTDYKLRVQLGIKARFNVDLNGLNSEE